MTDPALTLCKTLSLHTRDRVGCARPSTRQPYRPCRAPECKCGPSGDLLAIREALKAERQAALAEIGRYTGDPIMDGLQRQADLWIKDATDAQRRHTEQRLANLNEASND